MPLRNLLSLSLWSIVALTACTTPHQPTTEEVMEIIARVNGYWQANNPAEVSHIWDNAVYHTGNMETFFLTGDSAYYTYSLLWAEYNQWMGAKSEHPEEWRYDYGTTDEYVLFGDQQTCFQTYIDLYTIAPEGRKIARAKEVMEYQISTENEDYWWWVDGLYMVMPVMVKLYNLTENPLYLKKMYAYWHYADSIMYDEKAGLYYRDSRYIYPKHKTENGVKDFWARGDGWAFAALTKVLQGVPKGDEYREAYLNRYTKMAEVIAACQQPEGYWTRSLLDPDFVPGPETSGTAFFTYGLLWGVNNGYLEGELYEPTICRAWNYLTTVAMQPNGFIGYVQPIGDKAVPGQVVDVNSTANFGVGAFLLAACEMARFTANHE